MILVFMMVILFLILPTIILIISFSHTGNKNDKYFKSENIYLPYVKQNYLMTKAEHEFFKVLKEIVQEKYYIVPQVTLSKLVRVNNYEKYKYSYNNKIDRKSVDFVLFEKDTFSPHLVIELDDESHLLPDREVRDHFVDAIMSKVGLRIEHIKTSYSYDIPKISEQLK